MSYQTNKTSSTTARVNARPRSVPLAEAKAQAALSAAELGRHRRECATCYMTEKGRRRDCPRAVAMDKALARIRRDIAHWFDPGPDDVPLFDPPSAVGPYWCLSCHAPYKAVAAGWYCQCPPVVSRDTT